MEPSLNDPLRGLSILSLLSRTFRDLKEPADSEHQDDLDSILSNLKSQFQERSSSDARLEEAKIVLSGCSQYQSQDIELQQLEESVEGTNVDVHAKFKDRDQERRPAMGRKRAQFSFKPNSSQPSLELGSSLNIGQLQDPEDFFSAFEKLENTQRELKKQRGENFTDSTQHKPYIRSRSRRPGILGRTAGYKHRYSSVATDSDEVLSSSQGTLEVGISNSSSNNNLSPKTIELRGESQEEELPDAIQDNILQGSVTDVENKVNGLLDELLSNKNIDLEGGGAATFLEEHLQIKSINLDKFNVPDFDCLRRNDSKALADKLPRPRTPLLNINNIVTRISPKITKDSLQKNSAHQLASPNQQKSPFSSLSMLKKRLAVSDPTGSPFTFNDADMSPLSHSSPCVIGKHTPSTSGDSTDRNEHDCAPISINGNQFCFSDKSQPMSLEANDVISSDRVSGKLVTDDLTSSLEQINDNSNKFSIGVGLQANGSSCGSEDKDEYLPQENMDSSNFELGCHGNDSGQLHNSECQKDNSRPTTCEDHPTDQQLNVVHTLIDPNNEVCHVFVDNLEPPRATSNEQSIQKVGERETKQVSSFAQDNQESTGATTNEQNKQKVTRNKRKQVSSRKSLAEAGTMWESGVRRSTRIKMRPLEYWKGERFLYGRVHESLLTVIGCKYESPATADGKRKVKVKSFVSDEFKELVEKAALY